MEFFCNFQFCNETDFVTKIILYNNFSQLKMYWKM